MNNVTTGLYHVLVWSLQIQPLFDCSPTPKKKKSRMNPYYGIRKTRVDCTFINVIKLKKKNSELNQRDIV